MLTLEFIIILYLLGINTIAFCAMAIDKRRAIKDKWRISESTLMTLSIIGGSLGSLLGMTLCRHKTKHLKFKFGVPIILCIQLLLVFFLIR